jgi:hypothetical protein
MISFVDFGYVEVWLKLIKQLTALHTFVVTLLFDKLAGLANKDKMKCPQSSSLQRIIVILPVDCF